MDWQECLDGKFAKRLSIDPELIKSLLRTSKNKAISASRLMLDEVSAASVVVLYYNSLRELLEALALSHRLKIYNPECYAHFLKDVLKEEELSKSYDAFRKIRNSINYYGEKLSVKDARLIVSDAKKLILICNSKLQDLGFV